MILPVMIHFTMLFSQVEGIVTDTLLIQNDSVFTEAAIPVVPQVASNAIDKTITFSAKGYRKNDFINERVYLVGVAEVNYGDINLKADSIMLEMQSGLVFAIGREDSTGTVIGSPVFTKGAEIIKSKELTYNFKTEKAIIYNLITDQEGGILHSTITKKQEDGTLDMSMSKFTTCTAENPHFYISLNKSKVFPDDKIISGPAFLVLEDVPLPLIIPFGYFPVMKTQTSGIIFPRYGQEQQRGYFLTDGGYYLAINDNFDLKFTGSLYSNGTWTASTATNYNVRYKYAGNFSFSYANNIDGHKGLDDFSKSINYRLGWSHSTDMKARPGSRFTASVNMSSSGYDRNNSYVVSEHINTQRQSSVSYTKSWTGSPFNLSASFNQSQNVSNKTVSLNFPKVNFSVAQIYPLKGKNSTSNTKWYQDLSFNYSASLDNQVSTYDSLLFTSAIWEKMKNGFRQQAPLSLQIRPFNNFSITPQLSYTGVLYTQKIEKTWNPDYFNSSLNRVVPTVVTDTIMGLSYGHAINPSISVGFSPQIFGLFAFKKEGSRIQSIRHVLKPSVSFSFTPKIDALSSDMYKKVQTDALLNTSEYSIYEGSIFGTPSLSSKSGSVSFSLTNIIEGKVFEKDDTTGKPKKVKIIENLGMSTNYNIFADTMRWSPVAMNMQTKLLENINLNLSGNFSMYGLNKAGKAVGTFAMIENDKLLRLTNFSMSVDFDLSKLIQKGKTATGLVTNTTPPVAGQEGTLAGTSPLNSAGKVPTNLPLDEFGYARFDMPWTLRVAYNFYYTKPLVTATISQTLSLTGSVTITKKMSLSYTSGFDFMQNKITMTRLSISRDLHCWDMSFNWIPTGYLKSWDFTIRVKASVLGDLKYQRRKDFHEVY